MDMGEEEEGLQKKQKDEVEEAKGHQDSERDHTEWISVGHGRPSIPSHTTERKETRGV